METIEIIKQATDFGEPPIPIKSLYKYSSLKRITRAKSEGGRCYETPENDKLPSVTTILDKTADKTALIEWRKRVGDEQADLETKQASGIGRIMHNTLENYLLGKPEPKGNNFVHKLGKNMAQLIINRGLVDVSEVWGIEAPLYYPGLYAGASDLLGVYKKGESNIDFKNSKKIKRLEWITDYFLQGCAYSMAHNHLYGTKINSVVIFMASRDLNFKEFHIEGLKYKEMCDMWCRRLERYYEDIGKL